ncbi:MAG: hypothetical protein OIN87_10915 [Candidatus Methanoperedens sp.]|nr:hypothetical protein [Candidatus Methanoperedens sp.]
MEIQTVIILMAIFLAAVGLYISIISWHTWRRLDDKLIGAKAFLNKKFLNRNFIFVFITGALVGLHTLLEFFEIFYYPSILIPFAKGIRLFYFITLMLSMILLVVLAYNWCRLICNQKISKI